MLQMKMTVIVPYRIKCAIHSGPRKRQFYRRTFADNADCSNVYLISHGLKYGDGLAAGRQSLYPMDTSVAERQAPTSSRESTHAIDALYMGTRLGQSRRTRFNDVRYADRHQPTGVVRSVLMFLGWRWAEGTENLVDDSHRLFVFYPGIQDDAMPTRRNGATLSDFRVCHLGEGRFLTTACY